MVDALGPRAGNLADVWNAWGRVRPLLLVRRLSASGPGRALASPASAASAASAGSSSSSITITRSASAASTPIAAPSSRAQSRIRASSSSGLRIWLAWARSASILTPIVAVTSTHAVGLPDQNRYRRRTLWGSRPSRASHGNAMPLRAAG